MCKGKRHERFAQCLLPLLTVLCLSTPLHAQITVFQSEFMEVFAPGNPLYLIPGESGLIDVGNYHGPNVYDFTAVDMQNRLTMYNYAASQIPEMAGRYPPHASTFGEGPQNIVGNPVFLSVLDSTYLIGHATVESEYRFIHHVPYELFARFPLNYGDLPFDQVFDVYDTTYNSSWQVVSTYQYNDLVDVAIDGYGTLRLPGADLECLRMWRDYSWYQYKEFFFITREGVLLVVSDVDASQPDTGYVDGDYVVLLSSAFVRVDGEADISFEFESLQNRPNPFNPTTTLRFRTAEPGVVSLKIYDIAGREVRTLVDERREPGNHTAFWDGRSDTGVNVPSGVYFSRLESGSSTQTQKMLLLK